MSYATEVDMLARFGADELTALADRDGNGSADSGMMERALDDASAEIDVYLAGRYALPLAHVPTVLVRIACDIARYRLWADRASDEVRRRYEDARRLLERIASGEVVLMQPGPDAPLPSAGTMVVAPGHARDWGVLQ